MVRRTVLAVVVALLLGCGVGFAQSNNCGITGTWIHWEDFGWLGLFTPGANATVGQMDIDWVEWNPKLGPFQSAVRTTDPKGVWEKIDKSAYKWTWVAYGLDAAGLRVYALRASGIGTMAGCDRVDITGRLDLFLPTQNIWSDTPIATIPVSEFAIRMPIIQ